MAGGSPYLYLAWSSGVHTGYLSRQACSIPKVGSNRGTTVARPVPKAKVYHLGWREPIPNPRLVECSSDTHTGYRSRQACSTPKVGSNLGTVSALPDQDAGHDSSDDRRGSDQAVSTATELPPPRPPPIPRPRLPLPSVLCSQGCRFDVETLLKHPRFNSAVRRC